MNKQEQLIEAKKASEELAVKEALAREEISRLNQYDENRRLEFAKAFKWFKPRKQYDYTDEYRIPTWTEIFVELGKLIAKRDFRDLEGNVSELEHQVQQLLAARDQAPQE